MTKNNNTHRAHSQKVFSTKVYACKSFLKQHKEIIFTPVDKGNTTLCMPKRMYIRSAEALLSQKKVYQVVKNTKTLLKKLQKNASNRINAWKDLGLLKTNQNPYELKQTHTSIPTIFFPPKHHKIISFSKINANSIIPVRPVLPNFNSHTTLIAKTLHFHLYPCINKPKSYIKNSFDLCHKIRDT